MLSQDNPVVAQLRLMQLVSPSLPTGAYSYSQGLEWAVETGWVHDQQSLLDWLKGLLDDTLGQLDLPILKRLYHSSLAVDHDEFERWCNVLLACRETRELRDEEHNRARAMARLLVDLGVPLAKDWNKTMTICQAAPFAVAASYWRIDLCNAMLGYCWSWLENQTAAGIKLIPLGQTAGQRILLTLASDIEQIVQAAQNVSDDDIGASAPALALASCQHETQYSRLFRS